MAKLPRVSPLLGNRLVVALLAIAACCTEVLAAAPPFELNMDRVKVSAFGGSLVSSTTYFIPTVTLIVSASGSVWAQAKSGDANAQAHAKFYVKGLEKTLLQDLARQVQDDLVKKLRTAGYTVLTYDDLKSHAVITGHSRDKPDAKWNLPTMSKDPNVYLLANPTDEQAFDKPITGPLFWLRDVAKEKGFVMIVPEITFTVPQVYGEATKGYKRAEASVSVKPEMKLAGAMVWTANTKGSVNIQVQEHGTRLVADVAGVAKKLSEDKTDFSSTWGRSSSDYVFTLDQPVFSAGVLRVGEQINSLIVAQIAKAKK